jgi:hypothetical protein
MSHHFAVALAGLFAVGGWALGQAPGGPAPAPAPGMAAPAPAAGGSAPSFALPYPYGPMVPPPNPATSPSPSSPTSSPSGISFDDNGGGCPAWRTWVTAEYLLFFIKSAPLPPNLITEGSPLDTRPGALGQPGTSVLTGNNVNFGAFSGGRIGAGIWLDPDQLIGLEGSAFLLQTQVNSDTLHSGSLGLPVLAFPHLNPDGSQGAFVSSVPGFMGPGATGIAGYFAASQLWGSEANLVSRVYADSNLRVQLLSGFRYLDLAEQLELNSSSEALPLGTVSFLGVPVGSPAAVAVVDSFHTRNQFYGGQVGFSADYRWSSFVFSIGTKVGVGDTHESVNIAGKSDFYLGATPLATVDSGHFALASNSGRTTRDQFSVVPEVQCKIGYQILRNLSGFLGYDFLYWSQVVRPGSQVDQTVDSRQVPTARDYSSSSSPAPNSPTALFNRTDFWAQGLMAGLELTY